MKEEGLAQIVDETSANLLMPEFQRVLKQSLRDYNFTVDYIDIDTHFLRFLGKRNYEIFRFMELVDSYTNEEWQKVYRKYKRASWIGLRGFRPFDFDRAKKTIRQNPLNGTEEINHCRNGLLAVEKFVNQVQIKREVSYPPKARNLWIPIGCGVARAARCAACEIRDFSPSQERFFLPIFIDSQSQDLTLRTLTEEAAKTRQLFYNRY